MRRLVGVGRVDVDLLEAGLAARIVDDLDQVVLVLRGLEAQLDVALDGVARKL